jgi:hypothetical protein
MAINDYVLPPVQTTADAQVPTGTIKTPFTPAPVYSSPSVADLGAQFDATQPQVSPEETAVTNTNSLINNLLGIQEQSTKEQAQQFNTLGGNEAQAKLKDITAQYNAADLQNQAQQQAYIAARTAGGGGTASGVSTTLEGIQRENAVKKLGLASDAALLQGRVDMAKTLSEQAIKAKYGDVQAQIDSQKAHYELNKDMLIRADKKNYDKQQYILKKQQEELDTKKANDKAVSDLIIDASPVAPPDVLARAKDIQAKGGSAADVAMSLGVYGKDYLANQKLKLEMDKIKVDMAKTKNDMYIANQKASQEQATVQTPEVAGWVANINSGKAKLSDVPQKLKSAVSLGLSSGTPSNPAKLEDYKNKLALVDNVLNSSALTAVVGPSPLGRIGYGLNRATGDMQEFTANVDQLTQGMTLQNLIDSKAKGATFGALSEKELELLAKSATRLNSYRKVDSNGNIYYDANESGFKSAINEIKDYTQKAFEREGGSNFVTTGNSVADQFVKSAIPALNNSNTTSLMMQGGYK